MATRPDIEWARATWNPVVSCARFIPGSARSTAEAMSNHSPGVSGHRDRRNGRRDQHPHLTRNLGGSDGARTVFEALGEPDGWDEPRLVAVSPLSDVFHEAVPLPFIRRVFDVMHRASRHTFQVLTQRSSRLADLSQHLPWAPNIWMGVSVESRDYTFKIDQLRRTGALVKFLALEPLREPLPGLDLRGIDWVIVGGESGPGVRPLPPAWVVDIRDQCVLRGIPFFFKQWGGNRKAGSRILDGRTWEQMPGRLGTACASSGG
jgi:protein gp37